MNLTPNNKRLTKAQWRMVADNMGLVHSMLRKRGYHEDSAQFEEVYAGAFSGLCRAAIGFDHGRGVKFSTYACRAILNSIVHMKHRIRPTRSLDYRGFGNEGRSTSSMVATPDSRASAAENDELVSSLLVGLTDRERFVIAARVLDHLKLDQIGAMLDVTRERVRQIQEKALAKLRERAEQMGIEVPRACAVKIKKSTRRERALIGVS